MSTGIEKERPWPMAERNKCPYCIDGQATIQNMSDPYDPRRTITCPYCDGTGEETPEREDVRP